MENCWTLHVEDFGKIAKADITVAPLTLFVGDNNSGKSYLMTLLYTLLNARFYKQGYDLCTGSEEYRNSAEWLESSLSSLSTDSNEHRLVIDSERRQIFEKLLNRILQKNRSKISKLAFNTEVKIGEISISFPTVTNQEISIAYDVTGEEEPAYVLIPKTGKKRYTRARFRKNNSGIRFGISYILEYFIKSEFKYASPCDAVFLPTSRTGFLLTYKSLVRASISDTYDADDSTTALGQLTRPCSDFLKNLADLPPQKTHTKYFSVIDFIENNLMYGHVVVSTDTPQQTIYYQPIDQNVNIPMHLSSGVVTEVTPLLLMLKYHSNLETLFIEEPEIELHPSLQRIMARVLLQIYHKGTPIFITTHSDTILQHFNNMIKLGNLQEDIQNKLLNQYSYTKEDILCPNDVKMYQFDVNSETGKSDITKLSSNKYGFIVPTFNDTLEKLLSETRTLEEEDE